MEMMILSILGPQLHCEWRLPSYKVALITSVKSLYFYCFTRDFWLYNIVNDLFFFFFVGTGGFYRDGDQFTDLGKCRRQVRQKSSESHIYDSHTWFHEVCKWSHVFPVYVSVLNRVCKFVCAGLCTTACWVPLLQRMAGSCSCADL